MNKQDLLDELEKLGMRPGRGLGQNFLLDPNLLGAIARAAAPAAGETILEVGPGFGALTRLLLDAGANVYAIEFDHRLAEYLRRSIDNPCFHLLEADACRADLDAFLPQGPFRAVANLPYSISSVFIARLLEKENPPESMVFLLQKEMGQRLAAVPGCGDYGALSVRTQLHYDVNILRIIPPEVFYPAPEVDSALVGFARKKTLPAPEVARYLPGVVKHVFAQRRKQLGKVLGANYGKERALAALAALGISPETRPERLSVEQFVLLTRELFLS